MKVLFIQSGHVERAAQCLQVVQHKIFKDAYIDVMADDVHPYLAESSISNLRRYFLLKRGILQALFFLRTVWQMDYNAVVVLFTREDGFLKHKIIAFLARRSKLLVFNENIDCFFYTHDAMYRHIRWRWRAYLNSPRSGRLRTLNNAWKVLRTEGWGSFFTICRSRLTSQKQGRVVAKLRNDIGPLEFPHFDAPRVSIVIPVYNKILYTLNCLASILETTPDPSYEVIVVDDNSSDETPVKLAAMKNVRVIRSEKNQGFVGSCNAGSAAARGEFVLFLNNDTTVTPGWLSALTDTLDRDSTCGAVGSKLIYPDGSLQEAGGIIWQDASGWNYGKFDKADKPEYNYVRHVDYCSGAVLMVRREILEKLGGFDRRYSPAYWEDTDLCFSVRKLGYRVLYQPASVVVHYEGISAGTSTASGMKRFQEVNTVKFVEKWSADLAKRPVNDPANAFIARDRNEGKRILVIDHYVPTYDKDAGSFFMYSMLRALVDLGYRVVFWPENLFREEPYTSVLQQLGIEVVYGPNNFERYMERFGAFFDAAIITRTHIAINFVDTVKKHVSKIIYHAPDFEYVREQRRFELENGPQEQLEEIRAREFHLFNLSNVITTVNAEEADLIRAAVPGKEVVVIHHPINKITDMVTPAEAREDLLFVGSSHPPNTDAVLFYANEILPLIREKHPAMKLYVVGGMQDKRLRELDPNHVVLTGFVPELLPYFEKCRLFVAPLRYGAGVKGKVIDAMSFGLPIVTTSVGAEGMGVTHGRDLLIGDSKEALADAIVKLYTDTELWSTLSSNSKSFVDEHLSQQAYRMKVKQLFERTFQEVR